MEEIQTEWSRRKFVTTTLTGAGVLLLYNSLSSWVIRDADPKVAEIVRRTMGIDTHNHIDVPLIKTELPGPRVDLSGEIKKSGLSAICMTFAVDYQKLNNVGEAYERFINGMDAMDIILEKNKIKRSLNLPDLEEAHKKNKPTVIQSVEGGHFLEGKIERLKVAYDRGLRHLGLLHDNDASVPLGDIFTNPPTWGGLTAFGAEVIKECERLGILIDLAHCDNNTLNAALKVATKPVFISHTGLNTQLGTKEFMAKMMMPRLISKEQAKIIADSGGVIGVWTHLAETPSDFAINVRAMVDVVGIDHVAIGTDTKMMPAYRSPSDEWKHNGGNQDKDNPEHNPNNSSPKEINRKNQDKKGEGTNNTWSDQKQGFYYAVVEALIQAGFNEEEIGKIGGGNYCRIFDFATKGN